MARLLLAALLLHAGQGLKLLGTSAHQKDCHIFTLWNYTRQGAADYLHLNVQSWELASKLRCGRPILINRTNVRQWIPDAPDELFRLPYEACESDAIRYALIYHNGGIVLDTDFLAIDLNPIIDKLVNNDIVGYYVEGQKIQEGHFSSNFMAGRKGSVLMGAVWNEQKAALRKHCPSGQLATSGVCCYDDPSSQCSVSWAALGEHISAPVVKGLFANGTEVKSWMYGGDESFVPAGLTEVLNNKMTVSQGSEYWEKKNVSNPMGRLAYHLFNSEGFENHYEMECDDLTNDNVTVAGYLYGKVGVKRGNDATDAPSWKCGNEGDTCHCDGTVFYGRRYECNGKETDLTAMLKYQHYTAQVTKHMQCWREFFFEGDPLNGKAKHCICQQAGGKQLQPGDWWRPGPVTKGFYH